MDFWNGGYLAVNEFQVIAVIFLDLWQALSHHHMSNLGLQDDVSLKSHFHEQDATAEQFFVVLI